MGEEALPRKTLFLALGVVVLVGVAFSGTAFRIDDPLFVWIAKRIVETPLDPYGSRVNWYGIDMSMFDVNQNPPLVSYYHALVALFWGWGERSAHLAFLVPAVLCAVAVYCLAGLLKVDRGVVSLLVVASPVFLLTSITVMSDMWLTSLWCLACLFWLRGFQKNEWWGLMLGATFAGLAAMAKYFGLACGLLLLAYGLAARPRNLSWCLWLIIPAAIILSWSQFTTATYGGSHLANAFLYAGSRMNPVQVMGKTLTALSFLGGCSVFPAVLLVGRRVTRPQLVMMVGMGALFLAFGTLSDGLAGFHRSLSVTEVLLFSVFGTIGSIVMWRSGVLLVSERTPESLMMVLWIAGTFVFVAAFNWTVAGRNILPLVPAVALLVAKNLSGTPRVSWRRVSDIRAPVAVGISLVLSVGVAWSDSALANSAREAAEDIAKEFSSARGTLHFQGHWGFQYYMEAQGGVPFRFDNRTPWRTDDLLVIPTNNSNVIWPDPNGPLVPLKVFQYAPNAIIATMNGGIGAGFYSSIWGPLPLSVGRVPAEQYHIFGTRMMGALGTLVD